MKYAQEQDAGRRGAGLGALGSGLLGGGATGAWSQVAVAVTRRCDRADCHWSTRFKIINFMLCTFHLNFQK